MNDTYKCNYKHCKYEGRVAKNEAVKDGGRYYHSECLDERRDKQKIIDLYYKYYESKEPMQLVNKTINTIVNDKSINSEFVLYVLCQLIRNKTPMKSINALHYFAVNDDMKVDYEKMKALEMMRGITFENTSVVKQIDMQYKKKKKTSWSDTLF